MISHSIEDMSWDIVADRLASGSPAILPIGAGCKEHGFHLPLGADLIQAEWLSGQLAALCGGLVWPTLSYGYYPSFVEYAGSISISERSFVLLMRDILDGILAQTSGTVFVVNTGISTIPAIAEAIRTLQNPENVNQIDVYRGPKFAGVRDRVMDRRKGGHADEVETAIMLAIAPDCVNLARAVATIEGRGHSPGPLSPNDPASSNYSPSGALGHPLLANADDGRDLVAAILEDLADAARTAGSSRHCDRQKHNNDNGETSDES